LTTGYGYHTRREEERGRRGIMTAYYSYGFHHHDHDHDDHHHDFVMVMDS